MSSGGVGRYNEYAAAFAFAFALVRPEPGMAVFLSPRNTVAMVSQKNLSQSSLMVSAAPPRMSRLRLGAMEDRVRPGLGRMAIWRDAELTAARGGLDGGDGTPEEGTSGIPLGPWQWLACVKTFRAEHH